MKNAIINYYTPESTVIINSTYDFRLKKLTIEFESGKIYMFYNVGFETIKKYEKEKSVGQAFNKLIKNKFNTEQKD